MIDQSHINDEVNDYLKKNPELVDKAIFDMYMKMANDESRNPYIRELAKSMVEYLQAGRGTLK